MVSADSWAHRVHEQLMRAQLAVSLQIDLRVCVFWFDLTPQAARKRGCSLSLAPREPSGAGGKAGAQDEKAAFAESTGCYNLGELLTQYSFQTLNIKHSPVG